ncbi:MAG: TrkA family potassium uptake protein [Halovenus sp.]
MHFVIVGFGRVGRRTAETLRREGHGVAVVETDHTKVERALAEGFDVVEGDGGEESALAEAGIDRADAVGGLTGDVNTNFAACVIGDAHGCRTVLRVSEDVSDDIYRKYETDVDEIIYPERFGAAAAKTALLRGDFNVIADLTEQLSVATVTVPEGSPAIGTRVIDIELPGDARIYAHGRAREAMSIPLPGTAVEAGDSLAVMSDPADLPTIRAVLRGDEAAV